MIRNLKKTLTKSVLTTIVGLGLVGAASASTMTFEGVAPPGDFTIPVTPYTEGGFTLTDSSAVFNGIFDSAFGVNSNSSDVFGWCAGCGPVTITLTKDGGGAFDFASFDTAILDTAFGANEIDVIGYLSGGGTSTVTVTQTNTWTTHFIGFIDVTSVDFAFGANHSDLFDHAMDNLTMNVPEPASIALLGLGLVGVGLARRRA